jgi:hypothetical protein
MVLRAEGQEVMHQADKAREYRSKVTVAQTGQDEVEVAEEVFL